MNKTSFLRDFGWPKELLHQQGLLSWVGGQSPHLLYALIAVTDDHVTVRCGKGPLAIPTDGASFDDTPDTEAVFDAKWVIDGEDLIPASLFQSGAATRWDEHLVLKQFHERITKLRARPHFFNFETPVSEQKKNIVDQHSGYVEV